LPKLSKTISATAPPYPLSDVAAYQHRRPGHRVRRSGFHAREPG
jgi:hypothetical protein